ncbi:hypothetical protein HYQ46_003207 [Verticillium longisporum]|nr:hypothetical protein HYQ46_003207 [Verticillium longisporum]
MSRPLLTSHRGLVISLTKHPLLLALTLINLLAPLRKHRLMLPGSERHPKVKRDRVVENLDGAEVAAAVTVKVGDRRVEDVQVNFLDVVESTALARGKTVGGCLHQVDDAGFVELDGGVEDGEAFVNGQRKFLDDIGYAESVARDIDQKHWRHPGQLTDAQQHER